MSKSHVSMEQAICVVCGKPYDTGAILLDRRLRDSLERKTVTGWGMCPKHEGLRAKGYVALVAVDEGRSGKDRRLPAPPNTMRPEDAYRIGEIAHVRAAVFPNIFNCPVPPQMVAFVELAVIEKIKVMEDRRVASERAVDEPA